VTDTLEDKVRDAFAQGGVLSHAADQFRERTGQTDMAMAVARTIDQGGVLVVEAGTGVGKTFSYLVPALLSGERVLLSTATKTLQDQLFGRDLPRLVEAFGLPVRTALLKGRGSYLCLHRLDTARHDASLPERGSLRTLAKIEQWSKATRTGDLAELPGLDERSPLIPLITSTRENCLGAQCPQFKPCHVNLARREALAADIVVINHHLFFADLAVRETGMAELLPTVSVVVFDEAHQLNETGVQFLGAQLGSGQALDFARDMLGAGLQHARGLVDWQQLVAMVERAARECGSSSASNGPAPSCAGWVSRPRASIRVLAEGARGPAAFLRTRGRRARYRQRNFSRLRAPARAGAAARQALGALRLAVCGRFGALGGRGLAAAADRVAPRHRRGDAQARAQDQRAGRRRRQRHRRVRRAPRGAGAGARPPRLGLHVRHAGRRAHAALVHRALRLGDAEVLRVQSPFDYASQAALYVPRVFPKPNDPSHSAKVAQLAARGAAELGGRTLVLTTTLRALRTIGDAMKQHFELLDAAARPEVLVQGELPKRVLMERFREGANEGRAGCVLVASASFWEGFDAPGDALQLVVIDKLPFPPPNDPLVEARSQRLEAQGRSSFSDYSLPEAAVALKQGAGRLIRRETDSGVLAICDTRLVAMGYGRRLLAALPPMRRLETEADFESAIGALKNPY
jgi:ATP-dependent DNA helicase DinG